MNFNPFHPQYPRFYIFLMKNFFPTSPRPTFMLLVRKCEHMCAHACEREREVLFRTRQSLHLDQS